MQTLRPVTGVCIPVYSVAANVGFSDCISFPEQVGSSSVDGM